MLIPIKMSFNREGVFSSKEDVDIPPNTFLDEIMDSALEYLESLSEEKEKKKQG